jgi:hypothetical protein
MDAITQCIEALTVGRPQAAEALIMIPLSRGAYQPRTYKVLEEAISDETASISEISEAGAVPTLLFENKAARPVLLIDGDTLMGAKQNRTLNLSILIPAGARTEIPVSCVEAGRWSRTSRHFSPSSDHMYASGRAQMMRDVHCSMESGRGPRADQQGVWRDIDRKMGRMGVTSRTRAMTDIYEQRGRSLDAMAEQLKAAPDQVGAIFIVRDRIAGLELFDHPETLALKLPKLVRSYGLDAIDESAALEPCSIPTSEAFLQGIARAQRTDDPAVGLGVHTRLQGAGLIGSVLVEDGQLIRLSAFPSAARGADGSAP